MKDAVCGWRTCRHSGTVELLLLADRLRRRLKHALDDDD